MITLDTNAVIYYLDNDPAVKAIIQNAFLHGDPIFISAVTVVELMSFSRLKKGDLEAIEVYMV